MSRFSIWQTCLVTTRERLRNQQAVVEDPKPQTFVSEGITYRLDTVARDLESPWEWHFCRMAT
jgi:hypothetical protein